MTDVVQKINIPGDAIGRGTTVAEVKALLRPLVTGLQASDTITLDFARQPMQDESLFYADHFIMLPAFVTVLVHCGPFEKVLARSKALQEAAKDGVNGEGNLRACVTD